MRLLPPRFSFFGPRARRATSHRGIGIPRASSPSRGSIAGDRGPRGLLITPPRLDAEFAPLSAGLAAWQRERFVGAGLRVVAGEAAFGFEPAGAAARDAARIGVQAAAGLEYAHTQRIVHRDIKTSNLFFTREKVVKIMDFGLAKTIEEVRRNSTIIGGTPYFMAPEQASGEPVDHRTDLYAFGVTLFHLVTGDLPFREGDLAYHHRHTDPPDPRTVVPNLPAELAELILRLLAKDPAGRVGTAAEVEERLRGLI